MSPASVIASIRDGGLSRAEPEQALELWRALIAGRWSLVDHADNDGKRFIVARRNRSALAEPAALTENERIVAAYVALGHPNKLVAHELGLGAATVSALLHSALRKLKLRSKAELVRIMAAPRP